MIDDIDQDRCACRKGWTCDSCTAVQSSEAMTLADLLRLSWLGKDAAEASAPAQQVLLSLGLPEKSVATVVASVWFAFDSLASQRLDGLDPSAN
jgi:hypothetical protein